MTGFLGATFYPPRSSILIACEFMDLRSFKDVMVVMQASTKGVSCLTPPYPNSSTVYPFHRGVLVLHWLCVHVGEHVRVDVCVVACAFLFL